MTGAIGVLALALFKFSDMEKEYDVSIRMKYFYQIAYPPQHDLKRELGKKWMAIGGASSALELFEKLEMWDEVIECYVVRS